MPDEVSIQVQGLAELDRKLSQLPANIARKTLRRAVYAAALPIRDEVRRRIHSRTGKTAQDIGVSTRVNQNAGSVTAKVRATGKKNGRAYILRFLEKGTKPHVITPQGNKRAIAFTPYGSFAGSNRVMRALVQHPGTQPQAIMEGAASAKWRTAVDVMQAALTVGIDQAAKAGY